MSFKEKSVWISLVVTLGLLWYYLNGIADLSGADNLTTETIVSHLYRMIVIAVIVEVILHTTVAIINHKEADKGDDERDKSISARSDIAGYWVMSAGVISGVFMVTQLDKLAERLPLESLPAIYNLMHWLVLVFWISEIAKYGLQAFYYRRGF